MLLDPTIGSDEASDIDLARALGEKAKPAPSKLTTPKKGGQNSGLFGAAFADEGDNEASGSQMAADPYDEAAGDAKAGDVDVERFEFPKGTLGTKMRTCDAKVGSLMGHLCSETWRACIVPIRSNIKSVAGFNVELQNCEHPRLIELNKGHMDALSNMLQLIKGVKALASEYSVPNLVKVAPLLEKLLVVR